MSFFRENQELTTTIIKLCVLTGLSYLTASWILKQVDPTNNKQKKQAKSKAKDILKRIGKPNIQLSEHELLMASHIVHPEDVQVTWKDIAGLDELLQEIDETVIYPIRKRRLLSSTRLTRPPKGVLLHGPPGCGKTLIAKATAKESAATFISLDVSMITDKWYGESQKLVAALFSLAEKLEPCIVFIDEIDSLLRNRSSQDHEATAMMKAQFMFLWDGLSTDNEKVIIVMGATNRPSDLDAAILRRMPATFRIPFPDDKQREAILRLIMERESCDLRPNDYKELSKLTVNYSGSDLQELCRTASMYRVRECARRVHSDDDAEVDDLELRPITRNDMMKALNRKRGGSVDEMLLG